MKKLWEIFFIFMRIGVCTFGGGYAMLPIIQHELVEKRHWISTEEMAESYALAQCMPGIIFIHTSVLVIRPHFGRAAAVAAAAGVALPSLIIILVIAMLLSNFASLEIVRHAFAGIRIAVAATVLESAWSLVKSGVKNWPTALIALGSFVLLMTGWLGPIGVVLAAAAAGILLGLARRAKAKKEAGV